jgi:molybdopterin/thiamine biosynthesis adenylyltransferase
VNPGKPTKIDKKLRMRSRKVTDPAGREVQILEDNHAVKIASELGCTVHEIYTEALTIGIYPYRYLRNRETISAQEQLKLAESRVAVVGAGGLGGQVLLLLARIGIGQLVVIDHDVFDETNLNRQALCSTGSIGKSKSEEAVSVLASINAGVEVTSFRVKIDITNAQEILTGSDVVVDALDNVPDRRILENALKQLGIPLVHAAVAGLEGQIMTIFPPDDGLGNLYGREGEDKPAEENPEFILGVPALIPTVVATFQAMEVLKILLQRGKPFRNMMVYLDLEAGSINEFFFDNTK